MAEIVYIYGYNDSADGCAYFAETACTDLPNAFTAALAILTRCDHACIIDRDTVAALNNRDFYTVAPHAINISLGIYAQETKL